VLVGKKGNNFYSVY